MNNNYNDDISTLLIGLHSSWSASYKYKGSISQLLIPSNAKYNISGFIPTRNLAPVNYTNVLLWINNNNVEVISNTNIIFNGTVI